MTWKEVAETMRPPRAVYVRFPIGLTLGEPGAHAQQMVVIKDALALLAEARQPPALRLLPYRWRHEDYGQILSPLGRDESRPYTSGRPGRL